MNENSVLLVEDNALWLKILSEHIKLVLPDADLRTETTFQPAMRALNEGNWDLLVTDIGLPPDDKHHILGKELVKRAGEMEVPCIVVSGTEAVKPRHVRDFLREFHARDFFSKEDLAKLPEKKAEFQSLVFQCISNGVDIVAEENQEPRAESPQQTSPDRRKVTIGSKAGSIYVNVDGLRDHAIPTGTLTEVFIFFANNVCEGIPEKVVRHATLNQLFGDNATKRASQALRGAIKQLNDMFRKWAQFDGKTRWIIKGHREPGYCLNTSDIEWNVDRHLKKHLQGGKSVWDVLVDPHKMAANTVDPQHRLPSRAKGKPPVDTNDEF